MMRKRFAVFGVLALVLALLMPSSAFAWDWLADGTWWRGNTSQGMYGACVHAGNKYDAAAWLFSPGDPAMLSSEIRAKLSDPYYGGRFYEYAQTFSLMEDLTQYPEWLPAYVGVANIFVNGLAGDVSFYTSNVSDSLYAGAKIDFQRVLAGEDLSGGGGGSVSLSDYIPVSGRSFANTATLNNYPYLRTAYNATFADGLLTLNGGTRLVSGFTNSSYYVSSMRVYVSPSVARLVNSLIADGYQVLFGFKAEMIVARGFTLQQVPNDSGSQWSISVEGAYRIYHLSGEHLDIYYDGMVFTFLDDVASYSDFSDTSVVYQWFSDPVTSPFDVSVPPAGDWPEPEPTPTPTAPEIPTPTAPTVTPDPEPTQPTPTWPDITINIPVAPTVEVTPTGLDYTELLTRINDNLNTINSYTVSINSGLNSLRSDLVTEFESVEQALRNIYQFLQHLDTMLERHCQHLRDALSDCTHHLELYMKELFEWLPQQLNYDAEFSYDDSAVTSLLRAILNKIPGGSSGIPDTFKPNPQADEPGFFDWLLDLWHRFLIDLVSVLPDEIGGLVDAFSQLTHYFPFSIPWDLAAMLALFEHEPVTPVFDVPWGFGGNEGDVEMIRVDLSPWDGVMQMVRPVFVVGFCWQLALITKDLLAGLDLNKGGV